MSTEAQKESSGLSTWIHFLRYGLPVFAVMAAIFAVSQMSPATIDDISAFDTASGLLGRYTGDIAHFAEYFVLSVLILRWILAVKVLRSWSRTRRRIKVMTTNRQGRLQDLASGLRARTPSSGDRFPYAGSHFRYTYKGSKCVPGYVWPSGNPL